MSGRLLLGGVDWNFSAVLRRVSPLCRLLLGGFTPNAPAICKGVSPLCRLLLGGVDWNLAKAVKNLYLSSVASFSEAWIEILKSDVLSRSILSPPSRRRGLKYNDKRRLFRWKHVASFSEAWIEITNCLKDHLQYRSPPSRRRGLKFLHMHLHDSCYQSPPSWRCGLKYTKLVRDNAFCGRLLLGDVDWNNKRSYFISNRWIVASFMEAWIEIAIIR